MRTIALFLIAVLSVDSHGQAGMLDNNFDADGIVTTAEDFGYGYPIFYGSDVVVQLNDRIVVVGPNTINSNFAAVRYLPDGSLDPTFGNGGTVDLPIWSNNFEGGVNAVALQPDGKIVIAGSRRQTDVREMILYRLTTGGQPDQFFSEDGYTGIGFDNFAEAYDLAIQADGNILVCGNSGLGGAENFALARFFTSGNLDYSFSFDGKVELDFDGWADIAYTMALQEDGRILVAGTTYGDSSPDLAVARFLSDGTTDPSFGINGSVTYDLNALSDDFAYGMVVQGDGSILITGRAGIDPAVVKLLPDGSLDPSFNGTGIYLHQLLFATGVARDICVQPDGKILIGGEITSTFAGEQSRMLVLRLLASGEIDDSFGNGGGTALDITDGPDHGKALALQSDNKVILCGSGNANGPIIVARFLNDLGNAVPDAPIFGSPISVFPNPVGECADLRFSLGRRASLSGYLTDAVGRRVRTILYQVPYDAGMQQVPIALDGLAAGRYQVELVTNDGMFRTPLIKY
ncbi:MAG TPA: hypothetical protein PLB89_00890 [Flavobacteriales bacterium]|nr:hypothetical protein [Flavobacteriales bacterium]